MASETEACCANDPNFAVICSFLEKFGKTCGIAGPSFLELQSMLEDSHEVSPELVDLHVKLLRKVKRTVSYDRWEKVLIRVCHSWCAQDAWELERFGYKKAKVSSKLNILKMLMEMQFDLNSKFKSEVNKCTAPELRVEPIGRDMLGNAYYFQLDDECQVRVYKEDPDEETWEVVAKDREGLVQLITQLASNGPANLNFTLNEDSNSLEIDKLVPDTGQEAPPPPEISQTSESDESKPAPEVAEPSTAEAKEDNEADEEGEDGEEDEEGEEEEGEEEEDAEEEEEDDEDEEGEDEEEEEEDEDSAKGTRKKAKFVASEPIEEPVMLVEGEGAGADCQAAVPHELEFSEAIEEPMMFFYGEGSGRDCETGNTNEANRSSEETKPESNSCQSSTASAGDTVDFASNMDKKNEEQAKAHIKLGKMFDSKDSKIEKSPTKRMSRWDVKQDEHQQSNSDASMTEAEPEDAPEPQFFFGPRSLQNKPPMGCSASQNAAMGSETNGKTDFAVKKPDEEETSVPKADEVEGNSSSPTADNGDSHLDSKSEVKCANEKCEEKLLNSDCHINDAAEKKESVGAETYQPATDKNNAVADEAAQVCESKPKESENNDSKVSECELVGDKAEIVAEKEDNATPSEKEEKSREKGDVDIKVNENKLLANEKPTKEAPAASEATPKASESVEAKNETTPDEKTEEASVESAPKVAVPEDFSTNSTQSSKEISISPAVESATIAESKDVEKEISPTKNQVSVTIPEIVVDCPEEEREVALAPQPETDKVPEKDNVESKEKLTEPIVELEEVTDDTRSVPLEESGPPIEISVLETPREKDANQNEENIKLVSDPLPVGTKVSKNVPSADKDAEISDSILTKESLDKESKSYFENTPLKVMETPPLRVPETPSLQAAKETDLLPAETEAAKESQPTKIAENLPEAAPTLKEKESAKGPLKTISKSAEEKGKPVLPSPAIEVAEKEVCDIKLAEETETKPSQPDDFEYPQAAEIASKDKKLLQPTQNLLKTETEKEEPLKSLKITESVKEEPLKSLETTKLAKEEPLKSLETTKLVKEEPLKSLDTTKLVKEEPLKTLVTSELAKEEPLKSLEITESAKKESPKSLEITELAKTTEAAESLPEAETAVNLQIAETKVRKRARRDVKSEEDIEESDAKRPRTRSRRVPDVELRKSIEMKLQQEVSSSEDDRAKKDSASLVSEISEDAASPTSKRARGRPKKILPVKSSSPAEEDGKDVAEIKAEPSQQLEQEEATSPAAPAAVPALAVKKLVKSESTTDDGDKTEDVTSAKDSEEGSQKKIRGRPKKKMRKRGKKASSDSPVVSDAPFEAIKAKESKPKEEKQKKKRKRKMMGLDLDPELVQQVTEESGEPSVRQSRRIAQIKIKEEAERRKLEEIALHEMKENQKKKKKKEKDKDFSPDHKKKSRDDSEDDDNEDDEEEVETKKKKRRRKKHKDPSKLFDEANPWKSSSGSSTSNEEEDDEYIEDEAEEEDVVLFKSDHEFSPESDLEEDAAQPLRRARTAKKESDSEEPVDDQACQKCNKKDHPEWILLCDKCDCGWHCSCLRPPLLVIPEGDWYCPPCQHASLLEKLQKELVDYDKKLTRHEMEARRKERLAYVGISLNNVLPSKEATRKEKHRERTNDDDDDESDESDDDSSSGSSSETDSSSGEESEPVYQLRERRQAHSYRFNDYDELIKSAIQDELEAVKGAGNQGRGKDILTIINAEKEEAEIKNEEAPEEEENEDKEDVKEEMNIEEPKVEEDSDDEPIVKKLVGRKKPKKLNNLDISSEEDEGDDSDEDFKGSSEEEDDEDFDEEYATEDSDDYGRRRKKDSGPIRRSTRARMTRYDRDFINDDDSDEEFPKRKKNKPSWRDETESEESDRSWGKPKRRSGGSRKPVPAKKKPAKKKKRIVDDSDGEIKIRHTKKPKIKYGGLNDADEEEPMARRTRGKKINYLEALGSDSDDEPRKVKTVKPIESEEEYVANFEDEEADVAEESESNEEDGQNDKQPLGPESLANNDSSSLDNQSSKAVPSLIDNLEDFSEKELEMMMEEEEYANKQLELVAVQIAKEKQRKADEAAARKQEDQEKRKLDKIRLQEALAEEIPLESLGSMLDQQYDSADLNAAGAAASKKRPKKRPDLVGAAGDEAGIEVADADGDAAEDKRKARAKVKKPDAETEHLPAGVEAADTALHGGKLGIAAPPQPFSQSQPTPSVITRMLQSQPGVSQAYAAGQAQAQAQAQPPGKFFVQAPPAGAYAPPPGAPSQLGYARPPHKLPPPAQMYGAPLDAAKRAAGEQGVPPYARSRFGLEAGAAVGRPPLLYGPGQPRGAFPPPYPAYHYGAYPHPPAGEGQAPYPYPPEAFQRDEAGGEGGRPYDEVVGSGEFGGLVSYFSSQREDDLDT